MKEKIKLKDLPLLIKNDRRFTIGAIIVALILLWPLIDPTKDRQYIGAPRLHQTEEQQGTGRVSEEEAATDLIAAFKQDMLENRQETTAIRKELQEEIETRRQVEERTAEIFRRVLERFSELQGTTQQIAGDASVSPEDLNLEGGVQQVSMDENGLESFGEGEEAAVPLPPEPEKIAFIGAGDSVRVKLLAGVNAPTDGTPYPVVFELSGDVMGPDGDILPLGGARVIAAAQGSLTDSRALFRLTTMNLRLPDGRRQVLDVDGWVVGEDGIRGMPGVLIDPIGKAIAGGLMTGALAGVGDGLAASNTTTINSGYTGGTTSYVSGDIAEYAAGKGISRAAGTWEEIIKERLDLLVPVVQVLSNREGTAVFAKNVVIKDLIESYEDDGGTFDTLD